MVKEFEFNSKSDELKYYFGNCQQFIDKKIENRKNPFVFKTLKKYVSQIEKDVIAIIEQNSSKNKDVKQ